MNAPSAILNFARVTVQSGPEYETGLWQISFTLNPGDLDWEELKALGSCAIHERTAPEEIVARSRDAELLITNKVALDLQTIHALPKLRYIGVTATGYNIVDANGQILDPRVDEFTPGAVHVHDLQATILNQLGVDHTKLTYKFQGRDYRLTDVFGEVVNGILA